MSVEQAEGRLIQRCMERQGFEYWVARPLSAEERRGSGYVLDDVAWAREHGYGGRIHRKSMERKKNDPNIAYSDGLSRADLRRYGLALGGDRSRAVLTAELPAGGSIQMPAQGCRAEAQRTLYGDLGTWFRVDKIAMNLTPLYVPKLTGDRRFKAAVEAWSACMREAESPYPDPSAVRTELPALAEKLSPSRAHAAEVRLAVTEARCARSSGLADTARELEKKYRAAAAEPFRDELATRRRMQHSALSRARDLTEPAG